jgi:hypothetical protein
MEGKVLNRRRKIALLALVGGHLGLVAMSALHVDVGGEGGIGRAAQYYSQLTGADTRFGFFAEDVGTLPRATFDVTEDGVTTTEDLETGASREGDFHVILLVASLFGVEGGDEAQRAVAASMAAKILARHPAADSVVVHGQSYALPTMEDYRQGARPAWDVIYEGQFMPRAKVEAANRDAKGGEP